MALLKAARVSRQDRLQHDRQDHGGGPGTGAGQKAGCGRASSLTSPVAPIAAEAARAEAPHAPVASEADKPPSFTTRVPAGVFVRSAQDIAREKEELAKANRPQVVFPAPRPAAIPAMRVSPSVQNRPSVVQPPASRPVPVPAAPRRDSLRRRPPPPPVRPIAPPPLPAPVQSAPAFPVPPPFPPLGSNPVRRSRRRYRGRCRCHRRRLPLRRRLSRSSHPATSRSSISSRRSLCGTSRRRWG